jgi:hypothetical protein
VEDDIGTFDEGQPRGLVLEGPLDEPTTERAKVLRPAGRPDEGGHGVSSRAKRIDEVRAHEARAPGNRRSQMGLS